MPKTRVKRKADTLATRDEKQVLAERAEAKRPLTPDEFRSVLQKVRDLGLTWTADTPPRLVAAKPDAESALSSNESRELQRAHPNFPNELGVVVWYVLTGMKEATTLVGSQEFLEKKADAVRETALISDRYRSEFFFKHSIKVPYFSDADWEVVVKTYERNVREMPGITYALVSLEFSNPSGQSLGRSSQTLTVAVDGYLVEKLIKNLSDLKLALEKSKGVTNVLREQIGLKEKSDAIANSSEHLGQGKRPSS